jgi:uncharacterized protein (TIGR00290 family)
VSQPKAIFCWSGGKDSSYALYKVLQEGMYDVKYLLSTFNGHYNRLSMHGVREELIAAQAESIGIPLLKVYVYEASNDEYERQMEETLLKAKAEGISVVLYGDIFLEDLREYREKKMAPLDMQCIFPIWKTDTRWLLNDFIDKGFKTVLCCINDVFLSEEWCGREVDETFIKELPASVDPCGENGEFHTFCFAGPLFKKPISIIKGEKTYKAFDGEKGFWYCDFLIV